LRVQIRDVRPSAQLRPTFVPLATVDLTWTATWTQRSRVAATRWWLRNGADREYVFRFMQTPFVGFGLLPSLAWPFGLDRSVLYVPQTASTAMTGGSVLEIEELQGVVRTESPLRVDFVMPTIATAGWDSRGDGQLRQQAGPDPNDGGATPSARRPR
jgi:hypothetical protein